MWIPVGGVASEFARCARGSSPKSPLLNVVESILADSNSPQKHVWRAQIVLMSADERGTAEIMRVTGKTTTCVWRWQARFMSAGVDGLLHDKTRPSRIPPLGVEVADRVVALTLTGPPGETTHWTSAAMAEAVGISGSSVPPRIRPAIWSSTRIRSAMASSAALVSGRMMPCATVRLALLSPGAHNSA